MNFSNKRGNKGVVVSIFLIIIYRIFLDILYIKVIVPNFGYMGFISYYNQTHYLISWAILIVFIPIIIRGINDKVHPSSFIITLLSFMSFIPFTSMIAFYYFTYSYIIANTLFWFFLFNSHRLFLRVQFFKIKKLNKGLNNPLIWGISLISLLVVLIISWRYTGFRLNFNLFTVYDLRSEASTYNYPTIISYLYSASNAINPVILVYSLIRKNYLLAIFITFIQLLSFGINGSKSIFFVTLLSIFVYFYFKDKFISKISWLFSGVALIGIIEFFIINSRLITDYIIRRVMYVPNLLNYYHYDFFTTYQPDYFKQSFLRHFGVQSQYERIPNLIGFEYFNAPSMAANSGLISDAITNLGIFGIIVMPIILAVLFRTFDHLTEGLDKRIYIVSCIYISYVIISSFLLPALLTHGFIAMFLILYLLPRSKKKENNLIQNR